MKPVLCGCGGEAEVIKHTFHNLPPSYGVECTNCHAESWQFYNTEAEAIEAWNTAMGADKNKINITKGYWMSTFDGYRCPVCNYKCETTAIPNVCPHCGARLEWK